MGFRIGAEWMLGTVARFLPIETRRCSQFSKETPNRVFGRSMVGASDRLYRLEVSGTNLPGYPQIRRSNKEFIVPSEQLSNNLQRIKKLGGKVASITLAQ